MTKSITKRKARKNHVCVGCRKFIEKNQIYTEELVLNLKTNRHAALKYHDDCYEKRKKAEERFIRNAMRMDQLDSMRSNWDMSYQ